MKHPRLFLVLLSLFAVMIITSTIFYTHTMPEQDGILTEDGVFRETIGRVDSDGDGKISTSEWRHYRADESEFTDFDLDSDGYLELSEFKTMFASLEPPWMR